LISFVCLFFEDSDNGLLYMLNLYLQSLLELFNDLSLLSSSSFLELLAAITLNSC
jgi:hypothetical protein